MLGTLQKLGDLYVAQGRYAEAEAYYWRAQKIAVTAIGPDIPVAARTKEWIAGVCRLQKQFAQAETLLLRAQPMLESKLGPGHPEVARNLHCLSQVYVDQARYKDADALLKRAVTILEKALNPDHPDVADLLEFRIRILETCHQGNMARELGRRVTGIRQRLLAEDDIATPPVQLPALPYRFVGTSRSSD